jgi:hypothetical protein
LLCFFFFSGAVRCCYCYSDVTELLHDGHLLQGVGHQFFAAKVAFLCSLQPHCLVPGDLQTSIFAIGVSVAAAAVAEQRTVAAALGAIHAQYMLWSTAD